MRFRIFGAGLLLVALPVWVRAQGHIIYAKTPAVLPAFAVKLGFKDQPAQAILSDWGRTTTRRGLVDGKRAVALVFLRQKGTVGMVGADFVAVATGITAKSKLEAEKVCAALPPRNRFRLISIRELAMVNAYAGPLPRMPSFNGDRDPLTAASSEGTWIDGWNEPSIRTQHLPGIDLSDGEGGPEHRSVKALLASLDKMIAAAKPADAEVLRRFADYVRGGFEVVCASPNRG